MSHDGAEWKCRDVLKDPFGGDDQQTRKLPDSEFKDCFVSRVAPWTLH